MGLWERLNESLANSKEREAERQEKRADRMAKKKMRGKRRSVRAERRADAARREAERFRAAASSSPSAGKRPKGAEWRCAKSGHLLDKKHAFCPIDGSPAGWTPPS